MTSPLKTLQFFVAGVSLCSLPHALFSIKRLKNERKANPDLYPAEVWNALEDRATKRALLHGGAGLLFSNTARNAAKNVISSTVHCLTNQALYHPQQTANLAKNIFNKIKN